MYDLPASMHACMLVHTYILHAHKHIRTYIHVYIYIYTVFINT